MIVPRIMLLNRGRHLGLLVLLLGLCTFLTLVTPAPTFAASNTIVVTSQNEKVNFPQSIDFQVTAYDSASIINQATLFIKYVNENGYQEQHQVKTTSTSSTMTLDWHEDTTGENFAPPGTLISYYWQLLDTAGTTYTDPSQSFTVTDSRFNWQHMDQGLLQVNWYNRPGSFGQAVLNQASDDIGRIGADLGGELTQPINLWIYQSTDDFRGSLPPDEHEWVGGIAFPRLNVASIVVENMNDTTVQRDMPHELTHLIFHQIINKGIIAPTWFDEGLAVYHQNYHEPEMSLALKDALARHSLLRLNDISQGFPADTNKAYLAYAQSWNLVDYMYHTFGQGRMIALIRDMALPQNDFGQDLQQALGVDQIHLENQWRLHLNQPAVVSPVQDIQVPQVLPQTSQVTANPKAPLLIAVGCLLILLPMLGLWYLFAFQKRSRAREQVSQRKENNFARPLAASLQTPYQGPAARVDLPHSNNPYSYTSPPQKAVLPDIQETPHTPSSPGTKRVRLVQSQRSEQQVSGESTSGYQGQPPPYGYTRGHSDPGMPRE